MTSPRFAAHIILAALAALLLFVMGKCVPKEQGNGVGVHEGELEHDLYGGQ